MAGPRPPTFPDFESFNTAIALTGFDQGLSQGLVRFGIVGIVLITWLMESKPF